MLFQVPQNPIFAGISRVRSEEPADQRSPADGRGQEVQADLLVKRYLSRTLAQYQCLLVCFISSK